MNPTNLILGQNIYRMRSEKQLSQEELAGLAGVSRQSVSKWETGTAVPELDKLQRLCEIFGVSLDCCQIVVPTHLETHTFNCFTTRGIVWATNGRPHSLAQILNNM